MVGAEGIAERRVEKNEGGEGGQEPESAGGGRREEGLEREEGGVKEPEEVMGAWGGDGERARLREVEGGYKRSTSTQRRA